MTAGAKFAKVAKPFAEKFGKQVCTTTVKHAMEHGKKGPDDRDTERLRSMHSRTQSSGSFPSYPSTNSLSSLASRPSTQRISSYRDYVRSNSPNIPSNVYIR